MAKIKIETIEGAYLGQFLFEKRGGYQKESRLRGSVAQLAPFAKETMNVPEEIFKNIDNLLAENCKLKAEKDEERIYSCQISTFKGRK